MQWKTIQTTGLGNNGPQVANKIWESYVRRQKIPERQEIKQQLGSEKEEIKRQRIHVYGY